MMFSLILLVNMTGARSFLAQLVKLFPNISQVNAKKEASLRRNSEPYEHANFR